MGGYPASRGRFRTARKPLDGFRHHLGSRNMGEYDNQKVVEVSIADTDAPLVHADASK